MVVAFEMGEMRRDATHSPLNVFVCHDCVLGANPLHCKVTFTERWARPLVGNV